ncbi:MAG: outer membrane beta-barrel protein [Crocinitomicaceae bacterium]|nr:outer membrane beta-barrel protein [Crocinitomicaceae bacterium]
MKRVSLIIAAFLISGIASAQDSDKKRFTTGFNLGVNHANVLLQDNSNGSIENGLGFRMGLVSSLALGQRFSIDPKAELSFNTSTFWDGTQEFAINPVDLEFMTHLKVKRKKRGLSLYAIAGPNVKIPLGRNDALTLPTRQDVALDLGIGLDVPLGKKIRISPELRYSIGLMNITESSQISDLKFHNISLLLNFSGRPRF